MFPRLLRLLALAGALFVTASAGTHPIFCDRFEEESCLDLPRISLELPPLETFESVDLLIELEVGALADGEEVTLVSSDPGILDVPQSITFSQSQSELAIPVSTTAAFGTVTIEASATNYQTDVIQVTVAPRGLEFRLGPLIGIGETIEGEIQLDRGAPQGGTTILFSTSDASVVTISPPQVTIPVGEQTALISISGLDQGSVELSASATGYTGATFAVNSSNHAVSVGNIPDLVPGESRSLPISLAQPAPAGGLTVLLESVDPAIATVDALVEIPEGSRVPSTNSQVTGISIGNTVITARTEGFAPVSRPVTVRKFQLSFSQDPFELPVGWTTSITASLPNVAPAGGLEIALTNQDDSIVTAPGSIVIPADQTTARAEVTGLRLGSTSLLAQANDTEDTSVGINVGQLPPITLDDFAVGRNLQGEHSVSLTRLPQDPVDLVITVADPAIAVVATNDKALGTASITLNDVGTTYNQHFHIQGLSQGTTTITASAAGFNNVQATLTTTDSGFYIDSPSSISTSTLWNPSYIHLQSARINTDGSWSKAQKVRAGLTVEVPVASVNPAVGQITNSPVVFEGGMWQGMSAILVANTVGTTTVGIAQPIGFVAPTDRNQSIDVEVTPPYALSDFTVGEGLQGRHQVQLPYWADFDLDVTVTVDDPAIALVSLERTAVGKASMVLRDLPSFNDRYFYVQGLNRGTTMMTASAPGFDDVQATITVTDSGFHIDSPASISTTTLSAPTSITIKPSQLNADGSWSENREIRAGLTVEVPVTSADPGVGHVSTSPVVFEGGAGIYPTTQFDPNAVGTTTVTIIQPTGFIAPNDRNQSIEAEVRAADISLNNIAVGQDLQIQHDVRLNAPPPSPVDLVVRVADPSIAVISRNRTAAGTRSITFNGVENTSDRSFHVQGLSKGTTTITASAAGFNDVRATLNVTDSGFYIDWPTSISTTSYSTPSSVRIRVARLNATGWFSGLQEVRAGLRIKVPVTSADPGVGTITVSPIIFEGGTGSSKTTQFVPRTVGTTTVSMTQPAGFTAPNNGITAIDAEVVAPSISLSDSSVGENLQDRHYLNLSLFPAELVEPVDITLSIADPTIALISLDRTVVGTASITLNDVSSTAFQHFRVQGLSQGTTTIMASAAGFNDVQATLAVTDSGFTITSPESIYTTRHSSPIDVTLAAVQLFDTGSSTRVQEVRPGLTVEVPVTSADPAVGQIISSPVVFEGGTGSYQKTQFDPNAVGTTIISMTQPAGFTVPPYYNQSVEAEVSAPSIIFNDFTVGKDLQGHHDVNLAQSPPHPVDLVVTVANPAIAVISPNRTTIGTASMTFSDVNDTSDQNFWVQGLSQGTTTITIAAGGFNSVQGTLTVTDSGFYIESPLSISTTNYSAPRDITIRVASLNTNGASSYAQEVRAGVTIEVPVTSANPAVGLISTSPLVFEGGSGSATSTTFIPNSVGTTTVNMSQPAGFSPPINRKQSIDAVVRIPDINLSDFAVGKDLQGEHHVRLTVQPPNPVDLVITVANPAIAVVSPVRTTAGTASIILSGIGNNYEKDFWIQGLSPGTTTITASATGYSDVQATLTVTDSGFYISSPSSISTTTFSNSTTISLKGTRLHADSTASASQEVRAGLTVEVPVTIADSDVGQISISPVVFEGGTGISKTTQFNPNAIGTTTISMSQPPGFTAPTNFNRSIDVEVRIPGISLNDAAVGEDLQGPHSVRLREAPPEPVDLVVTVGNPAIALVSRDRTTVGAASITFDGVSDTSNQRSYVQGLSQGTTTITASAQGFDDVQATLTVTDSGFYFSSSSAISTTTLSSPTTISLRSARLDADGTVPANQEVRAGLTVEVPVISADPGIGQVSISPVVFEGGTGSYQTTQFVPDTAGKTTVSLTQPVGFTAPADRNQSIAAEVRVPDILLNDFAVGEHLQDTHRVHLTISPPDPVDLIVSIDDPAIALISLDQTTVGTASITIEDVSSNTYGPFFRVQGLSQGTTTITASAAGFNDVQAVLTVTDSGFYIDWPPSITTTTHSNPTGIRIKAGRLDADGAMSVAQQVRPGLSVEVPIVSANANIGQITVSPVLFEGGTETSQSTQFDPSTVGTTTVSITQPAGFTAPTDHSHSIDVDVFKPGISLNDFALGKDLQDDHRVSLNLRPPNPVDLVISVDDPAIAVVSLNRTSVGTASITMSAVSSTSNQHFYIQGLDKGTTTIMASASGFSDTQATLTVTDSGFYISSPSSISTTIFSSPTDINLRSARLRADGTASTSQEVRAGLTVEVPITSVDNDVGHVVTSPVVFQSGTGPTVATQFDPSNVGTTTISMIQPAGFTVPTDRNQSIDVDVATPGIAFNRYTVGKDLQALHTVSLNEPPPGPVDLVVSIDNPAIAVVSRERSKVGTASIVFSDVSNTSNKIFYVQGLSQGTMTITVSAPGFSEIQDTRTVTDSGFHISYPSSISTTTFSTPTTISIRSGRLHADGTWAAYREVRGGLTVEVPITSVDPEVGQITTSPVVFEGGTGYIKTTQFDPNAVGTTIINMTQPTGFTAPTNRNQSISAEVNDP